MRKFVGRVQVGVGRFALGAAALTAMSVAAHAQLPAPYTYNGYNLNPAGSNYSQSGGVVSYGASSTLTTGSYNNPNASGNSNALLWTDNSNSPTNLNGTLDSSAAYGVSGDSVTNSVTVGYGNLGGQYHAYLWTGGNASSGFDLNPAQYTSSNANAVVGSVTNGSITVGSGTDANGNNHALLWMGSTTAAVNLSPTNLAANFTSSSATSVYGSSGASATVGFASDANDRVHHALLWTNSNADATDLTGSLTDAYAEGVSGTGATTVTVGYGAGADGVTHALLWTGTSSNATILGSTGFSRTYAYGVSGTGGNSRTVGYGVDAQNHSHALLWIPSSASAIDLDQYLPSSFTNTYVDIVAKGVDVRGDIVGTGTDAQYHTVAFILNLGTAPEPGSFALLAPGALLPFLALRKRLRRAVAA